MLFYEALLSMLTQERAVRYAGELTSKKEIAEKLNRYIKHSASGELYLDVIRESSCERYTAGCAATEVKRPLSYMKACIYESLLTGESVTDAQIMFDLGR